MSASRTELSRWQFDLTWSLFDYHLADLEPADFRWEPSALCWTIRPDGTPDWADTEPDPIPVPTIAWLTWHIGWWWSVALDHANGRAPRERAEITWPGEESTVEWLRGLREEWLAVLDRLTDTDLDAPSAYPWGEDAGLTFAHTVAWVNSELMKNVAEIGQLRLLRRSSV
ncbi:DinB family protein [Amycolatopsis roodepoortensis]|uniref:DinB family protein n=1 Tax=Amycolatopsis roodepoortensis TaxID=700274 RepID=UPI00214D0A83|nr:DinB family protein [Amycolatopsis roodepoortensis]UUV29641.1 DinB family protein [Amycolatopsis roodepoortensis]